jgi:hypothetical protein
MKIKRGWQLFAAVIEVAIMAAVAVFGAVMIAVPVPILLHFLSKYGVTGTPATMMPPCRCAAADRRSMGDPLLLATVESFVSRVNDDRLIVTRGAPPAFAAKAATATIPIVI